MSSKIIFDKKYEWTGGYTWFNSEENLSEGTVRWIRGHLFRVFSLSEWSTGIFFPKQKYRAYWAPADENLDKKKFIRTICE